MAESYSRPYTIGVIIAVILIGIIGFLHLWRKIFKFIKKRNESEVVPHEIEIMTGERRVSSASCIQIQQKSSVKHKQTFKKKSQKNFVNPKKFNPNATAAAYDRKLSFDHLTQNENVKTFFAGFSHRHSNDGF
jgi:hypothetical protein